MTDARREQERTLGGNEPVRQPAAWSRELSVLLVDDEPAVLRSTQRMLSSNFKVETAASAEQAITMMAKKRYNLVLTDFEMPGKNGLWLLRQAKKRYPTMRRGLTSGSDNTVISLYLHSGLVDFFVPKPADYNEIVALIMSPAPRCSLKRGPRAEILPVYGRNSRA